MKSSFINCLGKPVAVFEFGNASNPAIFFVHGNSAPSGFFLPVIKLLEAKYHIITLDLPGHKQSAAWNKEDFTRENLALLLNSVLDYFNISEVDAFGFSMGGLILLECFDLVPAIKKIAIAGHPPLSSLADMAQAYNLNEDSSLYLQGALSDEEIERIYDAVIAIDNKQIKAEIKRALKETSPSFREGCTLLAQHVGDQTIRLNNSAMPIAIFHAKNDLAIQLSYLEKLQIKNLWEQKIQIIPDSGHFMIGEKPAEMAQVLDRFFACN